jgi:hypothetical protein
MKLHKLLRHSLIFIVEDAHAEDLIEGLWKEEGICIRIHRSILELHDTSFKFLDDGCGVQWYLSKYEVLWYLMSVCCVVIAA